MSRGALCWITAPTRGSLKPTSSDEVATMMSAAASTPVSWDVVRATRILRFIRPSLFGRSQDWPSGYRAEAWSFAGRAQVCQDPPAGDAVRVMALGVTQVVVQAVDHIEVVGERESDRAIDAGLVVEHPGQQHRRLDRGREQRGAGHRISAQHKPVLATRGQHVRARRGDRLDLRAIDAGQGGHEIARVTQCRREADEHWTGMALLAIGVAPSPEHQRDLGTRDTGVGVDLVEQHEARPARTLPARGAARSRQSVDCLLSISVELNRMSGGFVLIDSRVIATTPVWVTAPHLGQVRRSTSCAAVSVRPHQRTETVVVQAREIRSLPSAGDPPPVLDVLGAGEVFGVRGVAVEHGDPPRSRAAAPRAVRSSRSPGPPRAPGRGAVRCAGRAPACAGLCAHRPRWRRCRPAREGRTPGSFPNRCPR